MRSQLNRVLDDLEDELDFHEDREARGLADRGLLSNEEEKQDALQAEKRRRVLYACLQVHYPSLRIWSSERTALALYSLGIFLIATSVFAGWHLFLSAPSTFPVGGDWVIVGTRMDGGEETYETPRSAYEVIQTAGLFERVTAAAYRRDAALLNDRRRVFMVKHVSEGYFEQHGINVSYQGGTPMEGAILNATAWFAEYGDKQPEPGDSLRFNERTYPVAGITDEPVSAYIHTDAFIPLSDEIQSVLVSARIGPQTDRTVLESQVVNEIQEISDGHPFLRQAAMVYGGQLDPASMRFLILLAVTGMALAVVTPVPSKVGRLQYGAGSLVAIILAVGVMPILGSVVAGEEAGLFRFGVGYDFRNPALLLVGLSMVSWAVMALPWRVRSPLALVVSTMGVVLSILHVGQTLISEQEAEAGFRNAYSIPVMYKDGPSTGMSVSTLEQQLEVYSPGMAPAVAVWPPNEVKSTRKLPIGPNGKWVPTAYNEATLSTFDILDLDWDNGRATTEKGFIVNETLARSLDITASILPQFIEGMGPVVGIVEDHVFDGPRSYNQPMVYRILEPQDTRSYLHLIVNASERQPQPDLLAAFHHAFPEAHAGPVRPMAFDAFYARMAWRGRLAGALAMAMLLIMISWSTVRNILVLQEMRARESTLRTYVLNTAYV